MAARNAPCCNVRCASAAGRHSLSPWHHVLTGAVHTMSLRWLHVGMLQSLQDWCNPWFGAETQSADLSAGLSAVGDAAAPAQSGSPCCTVDYLRPSRTLLVLAIPVQAE